MHELARRDVEISLRGQPESEMAASSINSVLQRVTGASVQEIETLIAELETLRDMLKDEAARVQREIVQYSTLTQGALQSTKIIAESLMQWKKGPGHADAIRFTARAS